MYHSPCDIQIKCLKVRVISILVNTLCYIQNPTTNSTSVVFNQLLSKAHEIFQYLIPQKSNVLMVIFA